MVPEKAALRKRPMRERKGYGGKDALFPYFPRKGDALTFFDACLRRWRCRKPFRAEAGGSLRGQCTGNVPEAFDDTRDPYPGDGGGGPSLVFGMFSAPGRRVAAGLASVGGSSRSVDRLPLAFRGLGEPESGQGRGLDPVFREDLRILKDAALGRLPFIP